MIMKQFRLDINALRAIAIVSVVSFHFKTGVLPLGFAGVDVFFVISGFLMTSIIWQQLEDSRFNILNFYMARARRIVPALCVLCLALLLFGLVWFDPLTLRQLGGEIAGALLFLSNFEYWWQAGYFDAASESKILLHSWSLSVEWQFYLLYPIVLMVLHRFSRRSAKHLILAGALLSFGFAVFASTRKPDFAFYLLPTRAWEMAAGGLPFLYGASARLPAALRRPLAYLGLCVILASLLFGNPDLPWPAWGTLPPVLGTTAILVADHQSRRLFGTAPVRMIGTWSYSIYLWHWPVIVCLAYFGPVGPLGQAAGLGLVLLLAIASYYGVERRGLNRSLLGSGRSRAVGAGVLAATVLAAGSVEALDGLPLRFGGRAEHVGQVAAAVADWDFPDGCSGVDRRSRQLRRCVIGTGTRKVMLLGDSFAEQLYPRMVDLAKANPDLLVRVVTTGGCPPIAGLNLMTPGAGCLLFNEVADREALSGHYEVVVIASIWAPYFRTDDELVEKAAKICGEVGGACLRPTSKADLLAMYDAAFARLQTFVSRLEEAGTKVVIVAPTPFPADHSRDLPGEIVRREFLRLGTTDLARIDTTDFRARTSYVLAHLRAVASRTGATLIDPTLSLCSTSCPTVDAQGVPLMRDSAHLRSSFVSRMSFGEFDKAVLPPR